MKSRSRLSQLIAILAAALAGGAIVAASGIARSGHAPSTVRHHTAAVALRHVASDAATKPGVSVVYFRASSKVQPGEQVADVNILCPKKYPRPLGGIFDSADSSKVFLTASAPGTKG